MKTKFLIMYWNTHLETWLPILVVGSLDEFARFKKSVRDYTDDSPIRLDHLMNFDDIYGPNLAKHARHFPNARYICTEIDEYVSPFYEAS